MNLWMAFSCGVLATTAAWMLFALWVSRLYESGRLAVYPVCDECGCGPCMRAMNRGVEETRAALDEANHKAEESMRALEESWRSNERDRERGAIALYLMAKYGFSAADPILLDIDAGRHVEFAAALPNAATSDTPEGGAA